MGVKWGKLSYKQNPPEVIRPGGDGVNTYANPFELKKSECVRSLNTSSRKYPAISTRPGMTKEFGTGTNPITKTNSAGVRNGNTFHLVDGTTWKYWDGSAWVNVETGLTDSTGKIIEFSTATEKLTILMNGTDKKAWNGTGTAVDMSEAPETKLICTDDYRLYALDGNIIKASSAGSVTDWTTLEDSWQEVLAGMIGSGTAITAFNDMVIAWSDQTMHILMGNHAADSTLLDPINCGCVSDKSVIVLDGVLYFMDYNSFKAFTGGVPVDISQKVKKYLESINYTYKDKIVSGSWDKYIYVSIPYGATANKNNLTLEYDTELKAWYPWDVGFTHFVNIGENLYGIDTDGVAWKLQQGNDDGGTAITWSFETGVWDAVPVSAKKTVSDYWAIVYLPTGSTLDIYYSNTVDGDDWSPLHTLTANTNTQNSRIMLPTSILQNFDFYRLKFSGTGPMDIYYIETNMRIHGR